MGASYHEEKEKQKNRNPVFIDFIRYRSFIHDLRMEGRKCLPGGRRESVIDSWVEGGECLSRIRRSILFYL